VTDPLHFTFEIGCPPARAFELWTSRTSTWWPTDHSVSGEADLDVVFEGRVGGRIYERTRSGDEHDWGTVTKWEPPALLAYTWHLRADRADATDVEIRFLPAGDRKTTVEIDHRGWERLGAAAGLRQQNNRRGWEAVLPHFIVATTQGVG
jgi:uncharacterized protein YndB with AHSA1/START domain